MFSMRFLSQSMQADALRKGETIKPDRIFDQNAARDFRRRQGIEKIAEQSAIGDVAV